MLQASPAWLSHRLTTGDVGLANTGALVLGRPCTHSRHRQAEPCKLSRSLIAHTALLQRYNGT